MVFQVRKGQDTMEQEILRLVAPLLEAPAVCRNIYKYKRPIMTDIMCV